VEDEMDLKRSTGVYLCGWRGAPHFIAKADMDALQFEKMEVEVAEGISPFVQLGIITVNGADYPLWSFFPDPERTEPYIYNESFIAAIEKSKRAKHRASLGSGPNSRKHLSRSQVLHLLDPLTGTPEAAESKQPGS
jgi:hypothetical protein